VKLTGKELGREPFILPVLGQGGPLLLNCAAIPTGLLARLRHEKGVFTGAGNIGRLSWPMAERYFWMRSATSRSSQTSCCVCSRGSSNAWEARAPANRCSLIAATNRDLERWLSSRNFAKTFFRLNVFLMPASGSIFQAVNHFVQRFARRMNLTIETIPAETMAALKRYPWPGNIRELQNLIERAVILSHGPVLQVPLHDLDNRTALRRDDGKDQTLEAAERAHILAILKETRWVLAGARGAAVRLGINRSTLQFRLKKLGIVRPNMYTSLD
jgi:formate hydrogenlyase transcriptional activator